MTTTFEDFNLLLYGLSDCNHNAVHGSGISDVFVELVDDYLLNMNYVESDLYIEDGSSDPQPNMFMIKNMIYTIGLELGLSSMDAMMIVDDLDANNGLPRNPFIFSYNQDDDDDDDGRIANWDWLMQGFECIFNQRIDYNANYERYLNSRHNIELDVEQEKINRQRSKSKVKDSNGNMDDYTRRKRLTSTYGLPKSSVRHLDKMGVILTAIYHNDDDDLAAERIYKDLFEKHVNHIVHNWGVSRDTLVNDPILFNDVLALSIDRSLDELNPDMKHKEGHKLLPWVFGGELDELVDSDPVQEFTQNYAHYYGVPVDASLYTVNEVNEQLGREPFDDRYGNLQYHDVYNIRTDDDLSKFAKDNNYAVDQSKFKSLSEVEQFDVELFNDDKMVSIKRDVFELDL